MQGTYVAPTGKQDAQIVVIGEGPGKDELLERRAFVGASGKLLDALLREAGWSREATYCTNVIKTACPRSPLHNMQPTELAMWRDVLCAELMRTSANVYIPLGATALWAMTDETEITNWRGSLMQDQHKRKIIPTFHPAYLLRTPEDTFKVQRDLSFAVRESATPEINLPEEKYYTYPSLGEALKFIYAATQSRYAAFDIETPGGGLVCYSIAFEDVAGVKQVMSIPHIGSGYWPAHSFIAIYDATQAFLASPSVTKIGQNVSYDIIGFQAFGAETKMPFEDIMHMYHAIDPRAPKSLAFQASMHLRRTFWKDWEIAPDISNVSNLAEYNCKDSDITYDLRKIYYYKYPKAMQFYERHYKPVLPKLIQMYNEGICQDKPMQLQLAQQYRSEAKNISNNIAKHFNVPNFNVNSPLQLTNFLYNDLKLPVQYRREAFGKKKPTVNDKALLDLFLDTQDHFVLAIREAKQSLKLASFLDPLGTSAQKKRRTWDDRLRCEYKMTTGTGRLSSSASTAMKLGINLQNIPSAVRRTLIPAEGYIFLERDYRQAEAYVVAWDSLYWDLMHKFTLAIANPDSFDMHWWATELIMQRPRSACSKIDRQINKTIVYGSFYDMQPRKMQQTILEMSEPLIFIPLDECAKRQQAFITTTDCNKRQARIREEVLATGRQKSPTGLIVTYHEVIIGDLKYRFGKRDYSEVFRSAYSFIPQNVVACLTNGALVKIDDELRLRSLGRVVLQVHDSLLLEVLDNASALEQAWNISSQAMAEEIIIQGEKMQIPADGKLGYHWTGQRKDIHSVDELLKAYAEIKGDINA